MNQLLARLQQLEETKRVIEVESQYTRLTLVEHWANELTKQWDKKSPIVCSHDGVGFNLRCIFIATAKEGEIYTLRSLEVPPYIGSKTKGINRLTQPRWQSSCQVYWLQHTTAVTFCKKGVVEEDGHTKICCKPPGMEEPQQLLILHEYPNVLETLRKQCFICLSSNDSIGLASVLLFLINSFKSFLFPLPAPTP